jgi:hypothetical protein
MSFILLFKLLFQYEKLADDYDRFLEAYRTERSSLEKASFSVTTTAIRAKASAAIQHLSALLLKCVQGTVYKYSDL